MFEINIEEILKEFEGLSLRDKVFKVSDLVEDMENALDDVQHLEEDLTQEYEKSITEPLKTWVKNFMQERNWLEHLSIHQDKDDYFYYVPYFTVDSKFGKVELVAGFFVGQDWFVDIKPANCTSENHKIKKMPNLEDALLAVKNASKDLMRVHVKENELQQAFERIITMLCE